MAKQPFNGDGLALIGALLGVSSYIGSLETAFVGCHNIIDVIQRFQTLPPLDQGGASLFVGLVVVSTCVVGKTIIATSVQGFANLRDHIKKFRDDHKRKRRTEEKPKR